MADPQGVLGVFTELDSAVDAIEQLRHAGLKRITAFSPMPSHDLEHALHAPQSSVRLFTLVGGLTGAATGFALPTWTSLDWPLVTGGKPILSIPPMLVIAFEMGILFGALSTVAGLFLNARLPRARARVIYDPEFSLGSFGVYVTPDGRMDEARRILHDAGATAVRERAEEVHREV
ncbi:MAG TPA: DUF3341 domain-containing protein [Longimicrobiales bacterium]|nr:DUF3341 domain-containing protein [Longimicrobiales bacterium]